MEVIILHVYEGSNTHTFDRKRPHWKYWHHRYRKITELVHLHNNSFRVLKNWQIFYWYYSALKVAELNENLKSSKMDKNLIRYEVSL